MIITHGESAKEIYENHVGKSVASKIAAYRRKGYSWRRIGFALAICDKRAKQIFLAEYKGGQWDLI